MKTNDKNSTVAVCLPVKNAVNYDDLYDKHCVANIYVICIKNFF
jgi:hypothetical protein